MKIAISGLGYFGLPLALQIARNGGGVMLISAAHSAVNYRQLAKWALVIVDTRDAMGRIKTRPKQVWKA